MKISACLVLSLCATALIAEETKPAAPTMATASQHPSTPMEFDSFLLVLLVRPPNLPDRLKPELEQLQGGHFANMKRLADEGKLFKAGPTEDFSGRNVRGIFVLKTDSVDQAREWVATDPLVKAGRLVPEFLKWSVQKGTLK